MSQQQNEAPKVALDPKLFEACARAAFEANRAYRIAHGDPPRWGWDEAPAQLKTPWVAAALNVLSGADDAPSNEHDVLFSIVVKAMAEALGLNALAQLGDKIRIIPLGSRHG